MARSMLVFAALAAPMLASMDCEGPQKTCLQNENENLLLQIHKHTDLGRTTGQKQKIQSFIFQPSNSTSAPSLLERQTTQCRACMVDDGANSLSHFVGKAELVTCGKAVLTVPDGREFEDWAVCTESPVPQGHCLVADCEEPEEEGAPAMQLWHDVHMYNGAVQLFEIHVPLLDEDITKQATEFLQMLTAAQFNASIHAVKLVGPGSAMMLRQLRKSELVPLAVGFVAGAVCAWSFASIYWR